MGYNHQRTEISHLRKTGFTLVESLLASVIVVIFSASMFGFLSSLKRIETDGRTSSSADAWIRDRTALIQGGSIDVPPVSGVTYTIPSAYVGAAVISTLESIDSSSIPAEYNGLSIVSLSASWTTATGAGASRNVDLLVFRP